jgi:hypothetical protein
MQRVVLALVMVGCFVPTAAFAQAQQHGDFAFGYVMMKENGATLPLGIAISDAYRLGNKVDLVGEFAYASGDVNLLITKVDVSILTGLAGVRLSGGSRYGDSVRGFGQVLVGVVRASGSVGPLVSGSSSGLGIQPGFGVDVPLTRTMAIRPQMDVLLGRLEGEWTTDYRFGAHAVVRLFR